MVGIIPTLENGGICSQNYFIESSYQVEGNNKTYQCYLVTKMGCELLGNKQQGEKGILFTAKYVERFNQYEKKLKEIDIKGQLLLAIYNGGQDGIIASKKLAELEKKPLLDKIEEQTPKVEYFDKVLDPKDEQNGFTKLVTTTDIAKDLGTTARKLNKLLHDKGVIYKQGKVWKVYSNYEFLIKEKYCDYYITEFSQTLKWTEKGRRFIIEVVLNN